MSLTDVDNGEPQEIVVNNSVPVSDTYNLLGGSISGSATRINTWMSNHPNNLVYKTYVGSSGWMEGLPIATEDWADSTTGFARQRWTWNGWTQDDEGLTYTLNPRVTESRVGDNINTKRTTVEYYLEPLSNVATYGLVKEVNVFDTNLSTVLKRAYTEYNLNPAYTSRRIIGLPAETEVYGLETTGLNLVSKMTYAYDEGNFGDATLNQNISPVQHDSTNYGASFITGRGNLTSTTRWNVEFPTNSSEAVTSSVKYNTAGAPVAQISPGSTAGQTRTVRIGYADWNAGTLPANTFAYATVVTDPAGTTLGDPAHSSTVQYRYDIGANIRAQSPAPAGNTQGKITEREYDSIGRILKDRIANHGGAYARYEYPTNGIQSKVYSTIIDTNANGADTADEVPSETWSDGAGRVRASITPHTFDAGGSTATWAATATEYDILGRIKRQSVPTEITIDSNGWLPAGDDATRGWLWTHQKYDWMNRVVRKINTDGVDSPTLNDSDVLYTYEGCGCTGGLVTTIQSENVPRDDQPTQNARRTQKIYADIQGRTYKTEVYNWDGTTVYTTTVQTFNGRDQTVLVRQYAGNTSSTTYQDTTATFDGHGRLKTRHLPQQNAGTATVYNYNADDSVHSMVNARGAATSYTYNNRGLIEQISYTVPSGSTIPVPANTSFAYDGAGNRTQMTDPLGTVAYQYNELSQMTAETRSFTDSLPNAPLPNNSFRLEYSYTLGGQLKSYKDPYNRHVYYSFDRTGRLSSVTGTPFGGVTVYATNAQYRAWGALKHLEYGNQTRMDTTFNNRLQAHYFELYNPIGRGDQGPNPNIMKKNYEYTADGRLKYLQDLLDPRFDRLNRYDHAGRLKEAKSGLEARGGTVTTNQDYQLPYRQSFQFNVFGNMTAAGNLHWGTVALDPNSYTNYSNNRVITTTGLQWHYDADGRFIGYYSGYNSLVYNAAGQFVGRYEPDEQANMVTTERFYDGEGRETKRRRHRCVYNVPNMPCDWEEEIIYLIRSTVLGGEVISETYGGSNWRTYVLAGGSKIASKAGLTQQYVMWEHWDASGMSFRSVGTNGNHSMPEGNYGANSEFNPLGSNAGVVNPYPDPNPPPPEPYGHGLIYDDSDMRVNGHAATCSLDGFAIACNVAMNLLGIGAAYIDSRTDSSILEQLGIYEVRTPGQNNAPPPPGQPDNGGTYATRDRVEYFFGRISWAPVSWVPEQNVSDKASDCLNNTLQTGQLDTFAIAGFEKEDADLIIGIAEKEKISESLLAITWRFETVFQMRPGPNENFDSKIPPPTRWDVGGFHINVYWTLAAEAKKEVSFDGLSKQGVFGDRTYPNDNLDPRYDRWNQPGPFDGDPLENGRMAARRLHAFGGTDRNKARMYAPLKVWDKKNKRWIPTRQIRGQMYDRYAGGFQAFFDCYKP